ncbi:MAG: rod shape-determining protein MreC [Gammaproteobacteria bacterium]
MLGLSRRTPVPRLFSRAPASAPRALLLIAVCILLMFYDHQNGHLAKVHSALATLVYPAQVAVNAPYALAHWASAQVAGHTALLQENRALQQKLLANAVQLQQLSALEQENAHLRTMLQAGARIDGHVVAARLLSVDMDPFRHVITIDKGARDGVFDGEVLLDAHGIVGQVIRVNPVSAEAALITDPSQALQVQINRTGVRTLAVGGASVDVLTLPYLPNNADIKVGDLLVTSGLGGHYPAGFPVATVTRVQRDPAAPFATVKARALAELDRGHEVLLYVPAVKPPLEPAPAAAKKPAHGRPR